MTKENEKMVKSFVKAIRKQMNEYYSEWKCAIDNSGNLSIEN